MLNFYGMTQKEQLRYFTCDKVKTK